jgi:hypothetical protein
MMCIPGITPLQNQLDPPEHLAGAPGIDDFSAGYFDLDPEMAFDSSDRVYQNSF